MSILEQEILESVRQLDEVGQRRVLEFIRQLEQRARPYTASELMELPFEERNRIAKAVLASTADEDFEIFEAYSEEDIDGDTPQR